MFTFTQQAGGLGGTVGEMAVWRSREAAVGTSAPVKTSMPTRRMEADLPNFKVPGGLTTSRVWTKTRRHLPNPATHRVSQKKEESDPQ